MSTVMIARSKVRDRADDVGKAWSEYRLRRMTDTEFYRLRETGELSQFAPFASWSVEIRYVKTDATGAELSDGWRTWTTGPTADAAVDDVISDSRFLEADSLHPIHAAHVASCNRIRAAGDEAYRAEQAARAAADAVERFKRDTQAEFDRRAGKAKDAEALKQRMLAKALPRLQELRAEAAATDATYHATKAARLEAKAAAVRTDESAIFTGEVCHA